MGQAFVERYLSQAYSVRVFNRNPDNIKNLRGSDVTICSTATELINLSSTIILMVSDAEAIKDILHNALKDNQQNVLKGKTILQMATISPTQSKEISEYVLSIGGHYLEAPVLGSIPEAKAGCLIIMAAGPKDVYETSLTTLKVLGPAPRYIGETGSAAALKLSMNQLIASLTAGFSLSLAYAIENEVDTEVFMETVRESALYAKTYDKKLEKYLNREFGAANFSTQHLLKDINLFIDDAKARGLNTDALEGIERITKQTVEAGMGTMDYSSIFEKIYPET